MVSDWETPQFRKKFRIESTRYIDWDYRWPGYYFVTVCTKGDQDWFGSIGDDEMRLNEAGEIVQSSWESIPTIYSNVSLDVFQVLPDHFHGILIIGESGTSINAESVETIPLSGSVSGTCHPNARPGSLGVIINQFKGICTKHIRQLDPTFTWQPRFYDRVIRDEKELDAVRHYIYYNACKHH